MKTWGITIGREGTNISCEEMPWYSWFIDEYIQPLCCIVLLRWKGKDYDFHSIPLPTWITWIDEDGNKTNLEEQFGDVGCLMHLYLIDPIWQWSWKHHIRNFSVSAPWDTIKNHVDVFTVKWVEQHMAQQKIWDEEERLRDLADQAQDNQNPESDPQQPHVGS